MTQLILIILDDLSSMPKILDAWHKIGVPGATILESVGAHRARGWLSRVGLESLEHLFEAKEVRRRTLLAAIEDEELLAQAVAEAEHVMGGFDRPNSGVLLVLPVTLAKGLFRVEPPTVEKKLPPAMRPGWEALREMPVEQCDLILNLEPTTVPPNMPLEEVAAAMLAHPDVHVVSVIADDGRLIGIIHLRALADDLFFHILPEEFLSEVTDLEHVMSFATKSRMKVASDAMSEAVWVKRDETVKEAFKRMHENELPGLPVVDGLYRVTGYINLLELLALCSKYRAEDLEAGTPNE